MRCTGYATLWKSEFRNPKMERLLHDPERVAASDATILLIGKWHGYKYPGVVDSPLKSTA
jgi:hypothetical protein